jgi:hypothetical protein
VPIISEVRDFNGFSTKVSRLHLKALVEEGASAVTGFVLLVAEEKQANGTKWIRQQIDQRFAELPGWVKIASGGIDWTKANRKGTTVGVEVQVSGRSDMLAVDVMHLKEDLVLGKIDVGIIVVPDDTLSKFLTDRTPNLATALKHVEHRASDLPIRVLAFKHDGVGPALEKMRTNLGRRQ